MVDNVCRAQLDVQYLYTTGHLIPRLPSASLEQLMDFLEAQQLPESNL